MRLTSIVRLEPDEGPEAARFKLTQAEGPEAVLVIPGRNRAFRSLMHLHVLKRQASYLGKSLTIVAEDRITRTLVGVAGIPCHASTGHLRNAIRRGDLALAPDSSLAALRGGSPVLAALRVIGTFAGVALLSAMAVVLLFFVLPSATVTLVLPTELLADVVEVAAGRGVRAIEPTSLSVPARLLEVQLEGNDTASATGRKEVPATAATGQVTFVNKVGQSIALPAGAVVSTADGVRFQTVAEVDLPPTSGSAARVGIIALQPGTQGNVERLAITQVDNLAWSLVVGVFNEAPIRGGTNQPAPVVGQADRERLKARLVERMQADGFDRLMAMRRPSESIYPETVTLTLQDERFDRRPEEEAETLALRLRGTIRALAFSGDDVNRLAEQYVSSHLTAGQQVAPGTLSTVPLEVVRSDSDTVVFRLRLEARTYQTIDENRVRQAVRGKRADEAASELQRGIRLAERPRVSLQPAWLSNLPALDQRISVRILPKK